MLVKDWITLALAILGSCLGIYNAIQSRRDRTVRFTVRPTVAYGFGGAAPGARFLSIEVTNHSPFPITIEEVGLTSGKPKGSLPSRAMILPNNIVKGETPLRLDARHGQSIIAFVDELPAGKHYDHAFARTSAGDIRYGTSNALVELIGSVRRL